MKPKRKIAPKSSPSWVEKLFGPRVAKRFTNKPSEAFRKLAPSELRRMGLSPKSERYVERSAARITRVTPTVSKRQFDQKKLSEVSGRPVTLEQRSKEYLTGERSAATARQALLREQSIQSWQLKRKYKSESVARAREHLRNMDIKARGDQLDQDVYLREKAFAEAHLDVPEERAFYQKWFNYGHVKTASRGGHNATGRTRA
jgi:hypothetical protein